MSDILFPACHLQVCCLSLCPADPTLLLVGHELAGLIVWDVRRRAVARSFKLAPGAARTGLRDGEGEGDSEPVVLRCAAWSPDGRRLSAGSDSGRVWLWAFDPPAAKVGGSSLSAVAVQLLLALG